MGVVFAMLLFFGGPLVLLIGLIKPTLYRGSRWRAAVLGFAVSGFGITGVVLTMPRDGAREHEGSSPRAMAEDPRIEASAHTAAGDCRRAGPNDAVPIGGYACPRDQDAFLAAIREYRDAFAAERNPIRLEEIRRARARRLCELLASGNVQDWRGTVRTMAVTAEGRVSISLDLGGAIPVAFHTSAAERSRLAELTQTPRGSDLYSELRDISIGQRVTFSGRIITGPLDCGLGSRETDTQMMLGPRFYFRFTEMRAAN